MRNALARARLTVAVSWRAHRDLSVRVLVLNPSMRLCAVASAVCLKLILDAVLGDRDSQALRYCLLLALLQGVLTSGRRLLHRASMASTERLRQEFDRQLVELTSAMPGIRHYEQREFLDDLETIRAQPQVLGNAFVTLYQLVSGTLEILIVIAILTSVHPLLGLLPLLVIPLLQARLRANRIRGVAWNATAPMWRQTRHLFTLMTSAEAAKELRVSQQAPELLRRHDQLAAQRLRIDRVAAVKAELLAAVGWITSGLLYGGAVFFVVHQAIRGRASIGDVLLTLALAGLVTTTVTGAMESSNRYLQADDLLSRFVRLREHAREDRAVGTPIDPRPVPSRLTSGITLSDVSFSYLGSAHKAVDGLSVHLPAGSVVAVVGDNGAGKSTLVALLSRMYEPTAGRVLVDGTPLEAFDVDAWRARLSGAFQDFARFEFIARESVGVGDLRSLDDPVKVTGALQRAGAGDVVTALPQGLDSLLGTSFDGGVQLSGGQWQKLALGRALMLDDPLLLVLDEPTANLDPIAEQSLHDRYAETARAWAAQTGTITLLISHRFSTVRTADLIVVLREGQLVEHGSHEQLMTAGGLYAELYTLQARAYR